MVALRIGISAVGILGLILTFEVSMAVCGSFSSALGQQSLCRGKAGQLVAEDGFRQGAKDGNRLSAILLPATGSIVAKVGRK